MNGKPKWRFRRPGGFLERNRASYVTLFSLIYLFMSFLENRELFVKGFQFVQSQLTSIDSGMNIIYTFCNRYFAYLNFRIRMVLIGRTSKNDLCDPSVHESRFWSSCFSIRSWNISKLVANVSSGSKDCQMY